MIEVFKTNVYSHKQAAFIVQHIESSFTDYVVNFDLDDCDKILRIKSKTGQVVIAPLEDCLNRLGMKYELLS